jgi:hypothetical protein
MMAGGAACVAVALAFGRKLPELRRQVAPIYREKGILPPIASGLAATDALRNEVER